MGKRILMCRPQFFDIDYEINPWMHRDNRVQPDVASAQWQSLYDIYTQRLGWQVELVEPVAGLPDLVFTANGGLVIKGKVALPCFRQPERQGETPVFEAWFRANGWTERYMPRHDFEGEGDALLWNDVLFAGHPWRSDITAHRDIARFFGCRVVPLQLTDARFYHLDTAFTVIDAQTVALYPGAFTAQSVQAVRDIVPHVIEAGESDAQAYGLNALSDGHHIVLSDMATSLIAEYRARGYEVWPTPIGEFRKSGGGVKCLSLELRN